MRIPVGRCTKTTLDLSSELVFECFSEIKSKFDDSMSNYLTYNLTYVGREFYLNQSVYTGGLMVLNRFLGSHMKQYVKYI